MRWTRNARNNMPQELRKEVKDQQPTAKEAETITCMPYTLKPMASSRLASWLTITPNAVALRNI